jgi:hypothetical protein
MRVPGPTLGPNPESGDSTYSVPVLLAHLLPSHAPTHLFAQEHPDIQEIVCGTELCTFSAPLHPFSGDALASAWRCTQRTKLNRIRPCLRRCWDCTLSSVSILTTPEISTSLHCDATLQPTLICPASSSRPTRSCWRYLANYPLASWHEQGSLRPRRSEPSTLG